MRLEFEPNVTAFPLVENEMFDELSVASDFQTILKNGISAAQNGDREHARPLLVKAAAYEPRSEDAWMWLASISDYPEELLAFLNNVLNINPENKRALEWRAATKALLAKTLVQRGVTSHNDGNDSLASQCFDQALVHDNDCEMAWFWKASLAADDDQQIEFLNKVLGLNPDNLDAQRAVTTVMKARSRSDVEEAKAAAVGGDSTLALELLDNTLAVSPGNVDAWLLRSHLSTGIQDKLNALAKALEFDPDNAAARSSYDFLASTVQPAQPVETETSEETNLKADAIEADLDAETPEDLQEEPQPETAVDDKADEFAIAITVTEDHDASIPPNPVEDAEVAADECAYTQTVTFRAEPPSDLSEASQSVDGGFVSSSTLGQRDESLADPIHITEDPVESPRSVEELFGPVEHHVDADRVTVESLSPWNDLAEPTTQAVENGIDEDEPFELDLGDKTAEPHVALATTLIACPFCCEPNEPQVFECASCSATLTLSDIESLLSNQRGDREVIQHAVTQMEAEWNLREFDQKEMTTLALGHFNLQNYEPAMNYLQEASRLNPNDVILVGHLNTLAIRLDEIRQRDEVNDAMPKGKTILVVDDSPTVRKLISGKLEKAGHAVVCAVDGVDGLARIEEQVPDLILLDITMPRMDGYEVCKLIRSNAAAKHVPVVMISGKDGFFDKVRGRMAGTTGYITKPFGPETLMKALETYLVSENGSVD